MKKILLSLSVAGIVSPAFAQLPVSTTPQNKKVLLEEFTGINCQHCPGGHKIANDLKASKPAGSVILANIHTGSFATPGPGQPDYRTSDGTAIATMPGMGATSFPTGSINRHVFSGQSAMAMSRSVWTRFADSILNQPSYVNVALEGSLNVSTRVITVNTQVHFTANSTAAANRLTVMLLEESVFGPQIDNNGSGGIYYPVMRNPDGTYTHNHMLRKVLSASALGDTITNRTSGSTTSKTYTYTIPAQYVNNVPYLGNLRVIAFVTEGNTEVVTAAEGPVTLSGFNYNKDASVSNLNSEVEVCQGPLNPSITIYNNGSTVINNAVLSYNVNGGTNSTYTVTGPINPATIKNIILPAITFTPQASNTLNLTVGNVDGSADQNTANNAVSKSAILLTTRIANDRNMTMNFTQDAYGSESSWKLIDEATGNTVAQDGPFSDLTTAGTVLHTKRFSVDPSKCYKLIVVDAYGDGINGQYGAGRYELKSSSTVLISSNGQYGAGETKLFKTAANLGNVNVGNLSSNFSSITLFPNPTKDNAMLSFDIQQRTNVTITVIDGLGRVTTNVANRLFEAGNNKVEINTATLPTGVYSVRIQSENGLRTERLSVVK